MKGLELAVVEEIVVALALSSACYELCDKKTKKTLQDVSGVFPQGCMGPCKQIPHIDGKGTHLRRCTGLQVHCRWQAGGIPGWVFLSGFYSAMLELSVHLMADRLWLGKRHKTKTLAHRVRDLPRQIHVEDGDGVTCSHKKHKHTNSRNQARTLAHDTRQTSCTRT